LAIWLAKEVIHVPVLDFEISGMGWGVEGAWIAMAIDLVARSVMVLVRFWHGGWKHKVV
jgi:Na+-driven multidrug efflux pump